MVKPLKFKAKKKRMGNALFVKWLGGAKEIFFQSLPFALSLTALGLFFGGVVAYAVNSPTFDLREVRVLNLGTLTPEQSF